MKRPLVSVVVAAYNAAGTIGECLRSLERAEARGECEVIVVDSSTDGTAAIVAREFPSVRLFTFGERRYPGSARNFGVGQARGEVIAFTDADCVVAGGWLRRIIEAHRGALPVVGGAVDNASRDSYVGWAYYFCEFSQWMPGAPEGFKGEIPTCCLSMKRAAFDAYGPFLEGTYCSDTAFHWKLQRAGFRPLFVPAIQVAHQYRGGVGSFLRHSVFHGKSFGRVRTSEHGLSRGARALFALRTLYLPLLQFALTARRVFGGGLYVREFLRTSPLVFLGIAAWSWGELTGYLSPSRGEMRSRR